MILSSVAHTQKPFRDRWRPKERLVSQAPQTLRLRIDVLRSKPREVLLLSRDHAVSGQWIIAIGAADSANGWRRCPDRGRHVRLPKQAAGGARQKTVLSKVVKAMVRSQRAAVRFLPREELELMIAAKTDS